MIEDTILDRSDVLTTVIRVRFAPGNGTEYDMVITKMPPGLASALNIVSIYGFGTMWMGDPRHLSSGYFREKIPLATQSDAIELVKMIKHVLKGPDTFSTPK